MILNIHHNQAIEIIVNFTAKKVRELRESLGWTQYELAKRADLTANYITRFENGEFENPRKSTTDALARALGVSPHELIESFGDSMLERSPPLYQEPEMENWMELGAAMSPEERKKAKKFIKEFILKDAGVKTQKKIS